MAKKKKQDEPQAAPEAAAETKQTQPEAKKPDVLVDTETGEIIEKKESAKQKREPQMVTVNGDQITHGHIFKSNKSDDWFFSVKMNGRQLPPRVVTLEDTTAFMEKKMSVKDMMERYYPTKLMPKVSEKDFNALSTVNTPGGEEQVHKFNLYKTDPEEWRERSVYMFYAQVGDQKMSTRATKEQLDHFFDRTMTKADLLKNVFARQLALPEYYQQFKLPEGVKESHVKILKDDPTKTWQVNVYAGGKFQSADLDYYDKQALFKYETASKEQIAAMKLGPQIKEAISQALAVANKQEQKSAMSR